MTGRRFAIVQEYVPAYRAPLFDKLAEALSAEGDELTVFGENHRARSHNDEMPFGTARGCARSGSERYVCSESD